MSNKNQLLLEPMSFVFRMRIRKTLKKNLIRKTLTLSFRVSLKTAFVFTLLYNSCAYI